MKKNDVTIGQHYIAKVSGNLAEVRIDRENQYGGWDATNVGTGRRVHIKSAQRLRAKAGRVGGEQPEPTADGGDAEVETPARGLTYHAERCGTPRCKGEPVMTHLSKPLCQRCWERQCEEDEASEAPQDAALRLADATEEPAAVDAAANETDAAAGAANKEETDMATKTTKKTAKGTKSTKAKGTKKATKPEAAAKAPKKVNGAKANGEPKRMSALDAAATVLKKSGKPMRAQDLIIAMSDQGLWTSPGGKTPHATLYAAMIREAATKGKEARFTKVDRGQFAFNG